MDSEQPTRADPGAGGGAASPDLGPLGVVLDRDAGCDRAGADRGGAGADGGDVSAWAPGPLRSQKRRRKARGGGGLRLRSKVRRTYQRAMAPSGCAWGVLGRQQAGDAADGVHHLLGGDQPLHSNWRGVPAWRGHHRKSLWSKRTRGSFQQQLQACQLITRYGVANSLVGWVKPLIITTGQPAAQASQDRPLRQADEERRVPQPARPLGQRPVAGLVLGAVRDVGPHQARAVHRLLVDADDAVAGCLQEARPPRASRAGCSSICSRCWLCTAMQT